MFDQTLVLNFVWLRSYAAEELSSLSTKIDELVASRKSASEILELFPPAVQKTEVSLGIEELDEYMSDVGKATIARKLWEYHKD